MPSDGGVSRCAWLRHPVDVRAVMVSGPGGVGKTTAVLAAQRLLSPGWLIFEADKCYPHLPEDPAFATLANDRRLARAALASAHAYVAEGFPTFVEMDVTDPWRRSTCEEVFADVPLMFVVLWASRDVAMARVRDRGTDPRFFEWFETQYDAVGWKSLDSHLIDTTDSAPDEVAGRLIELIKSSADA